jgi:hypothetical protein
MKATFIAITALAATAASAQYCGSNFGYPPNNAYVQSYYPACYGTPGQVIYLGGYYRPSPRTPSNIPFAYASFFYGQSLSDYLRSQYRR